jgi:hypothetical protein
LEDIMSTSGEDRGRRREPGGQAQAPHDPPSKPAPAPQTPPLQDPPLEPEHDRRWRPESLWSAEEAQAGIIFDENNVPS